ncbi:MULTISPECIES: 50S ribosomal protein L25/general stress protein Ctc [Chromohalobacter]|uniref:Large ribosomal subunit protein bL25 n=2 Tax=Chromohalobacter TaxID=42054 RepID=A0A9X2X0E2_9GAMM|nr:MULTISPECIES: 50S ribosomal protein L25/general stress protein Ctc [Chromohalobacter]CDQ33017.1 General stress protein CTC [Virgibacillus halodenitrificans]MCK0753132.1 50S ribosomal protein L25/general stress protein Ctc [Chromohalobacter japonicus]MCK0764228.1 50S ribosomal protein L25/general stress protein Ctc [Chromohalobacter beijerinckii]MCK2042012.1 50S ribosomal protein L25/general stress protein Ctc [Chromohalobacter moromii]MCK2044934.1 50S ribosomal protein L25/general stress pr
MSQFTLSAKVRHDLGKGASRRLRRENQKVAAIIYGGDKTPQPITLDKPAFYKAIEDEAFFSSVINIDLEGKSEQVIIRDIQRHPYKALVTHADFMRVDATHEITMNVPLHVNGEDACKGVKEEGGVLHVLANDVEISCLPSKLPEYLEVDVASLGLGETLHLSDLPLPEGVSLVALSHGEEHDFGVVSVTRADTGTEGDEEDEEGGDDAAAEDGEKTE